MTDRIQKILSARGVCSRRQAEAYILDGRVTCNGLVCTLGQSADPEVDLILLDGKPIPSNQEFVYIMLHKPKGYVTTMSDEKGRKNAAQLVTSCGKRVYPVGRLDMDSEGLLLFTNDGDFAQKLTHPSHMIDKTYLVTVKNFSAEGLERLKKPIYLDGRKLQIPRVELSSCENEVKLYFTIHEGRNRQVRRMCAVAGMSVKRLVRTSVGKLELGDLPVGKWRYLTAEELKLLN